MRYAIALVLLLGLAIAMTPRSDAGVSCDTDLDGVGGCSGVGSDNCELLSNGPALQDPGSPQCDAQEDGDMDGYGNPCDSDINDDGATGLDDVSLMLSAATAVSTVPEFDLNCDGAAGLDDLSRAVAHASFVQLPGPSALSCAGTIPCP